MKRKADTNILKNRKKIALLSPDVSSLGENEYISDLVN